MSPFGGFPPPVLHVQLAGSSSLEEPWKPLSRLSSTTLVAEEATLAQSMVPTLSAVMLPSSSKEPTVPLLTVTALAMRVTPNTPTSSASRPTTLASRHRNLVTSTSSFSEGPGSLWLRPGAVTSFCPGFDASPDDRPRRADG